MFNNASNGNYYIRKINTINIIKGRIESSLRSYKTELEELNKKYDIKNKINTLENIDKDLIALQVEYIKNIIEFIIKTIENYGYEKDVYFNSGIYITIPRSIESIPFNYIYKDIKSFTNYSYDIEGDLIRCAFDSGIEISIRKEILTNEDYYNQIMDNLRSLWSQE